MTQPYHLSPLPRCRDCDQAPRDALRNHQNDVVALLCAQHGPPALAELLARHGDGA